LWRLFLLFGRLLFEQPMLVFFVLVAMTPRPCGRSVPVERGGLHFSLNPRAPRSPPLLLAGTH
jgi:hypothetical protein